MLILLVLLNLFSLHRVPEKYLLRDAIEEGYRENYEKAESLILIYSEKVKDSPLGPLFAAGLYDLYMLDFSTDSKKDEFFKNLDLAIKRAEKIIKNSQNRDKREVAWAYFAKGSALSYKALFYGRKKNFVKALYYAFPAHKALKKAIETDSTLYDDYLPLGTYDYALSELPKFVKWLSGVSDEREKALNEMRLASEKGEFVNIIAQDALAWTLAYHRSFREAERLSRKLVTKFPKSRTFRWTLCYILRRSGQWKKASEEYKKLLYLVVKGQKKCPYCLAITYMWLSRSQYFSFNKKSARRNALCGLILTHQIKKSGEREYLLKNFNWILEHTGG